jgi:predicted ATPase/transcriptional regulator with XRE-family HTH domain
VERSADTGAQPLSFAELLRKHRAAAGLSQEELADRALLSVKTISALEQGIRQKPYRHTIANLADALGLSGGARIELERAGARSASPIAEPVQRVTLLLAKCDTDKDTTEAAQFDQIVSRIIGTHDGRPLNVSRSEVGGSFLRPANAVNAAASIQRQQPQVKIVLHTGSFDVMRASHMGSALARAARLLEVAHEGQILVSAAAEDLLGSDLPGAVHLDSLGLHRLRDLAVAENVYQLIVPGVTASHPPLGTLESLPNNLPAQLSSFVGREHDVAAIKTLLAAHRLVTLVGTGGIGKTRLALHVAADMIEAAGQGVWFVDFAPLTNSSLVADTIAAALRLQAPAGGRSLETLITYLNQKPSLLILDNCEHLIDEVATIADALLQHAPGVRILATSREALRLGGERAYRVPSLEVPPPGGLDSLKAEDALAYGAVALFVDRATAADCQFALTEELVPTVVEICRHLDGIALAIELAAARVNVLSPKTLEQSLRERFLVLTGGNRTALPRHKTMRALIDWSYDLLNEKEQRFLRTLSIFTDGFTHDLLIGLCEHEGSTTKDDIFELLASLVDKSLVQTEVLTDGPERYRLLDSTRQYALEKLSEHGEHDAVAHAHTLALLDLSRRFDSVLELKSDRLWRNLTAVGVGNWRSAMEWALLSGGDVLAGQELAASRGVSWFGQTPGESRHWVQDALQACTDDTPLALRAKLELAAARFATALGRLDSTAALEAAERALMLYQRAQDDLGVAEAQSYVGLSLVFRRRTVEGKHLLEDALRTARARDAQWLIGVATNALAAAHSLEGDLSTARALFRDALNLFKPAECERYAAQIATGLAETEYFSGNIQTAVDLSREAAQLLRANRSWVSLANALCNCSAFLITLNRFDEAHEDALEALQLSRETGMSVRVVQVLQRLAAIAALRGIHLRQAASVLGFVDERLRELENTRQVLEQQEYDKVLLVLRKELGSSLEELMELGARWPEDRVAAEALKL